VKRQAGPNLRCGFGRWPCSPPSAAQMRPAFGLHQYRACRTHPARCGPETPARYSQTPRITDKPFNRTSRTIDLSNRLRTPSEPRIFCPCGRFTMKKCRKHNP
jgi:hypothetical protein